MESISFYVQSDPNGKSIDTHELLLQDLHRTNLYQALPNLRRLFVDARTEAEESKYSRNAVGIPMKTKLTFPSHGTNCARKFYNLILFMSSVAVFSLAAQRMSVGKAVGH